MRENAACALINMQVISLAGAKITPAWITALSVARFRENDKVTQSNNVEFGILVLRCKASDCYTIGSILMSPDFEHTSRARSQRLLGCIPRQRQLLRTASVHTMVVTRHEPSLSVP